LWGECKILLVEFFKLIKEDSTQIGVQQCKVEGQTQPKSEVQSIGHPQNVHSEIQGVAVDRR